jgi:S-adenosylmethionine synthetase
MSIDTVRELIGQLIDEELNDVEIYNKEDCIIHINPTGKYVSHSPLHDSGLTGRKLIVDTFGGYSPIGGGAQSSKDPSKVDRSGLYLARYIAKNIVAAGLATKCVVQISYAIGVVKPVSIAVDTYGTYTSINDDDLSELVKDTFPSTPKWIIEKFKLTLPSKDNFFYSDVASKGQVGYHEYPWEQLDSVDILKEKVKNLL